MTAGSRVAARSTSRVAAGLVAAVVATAAMRAVAGTAVAGLPSPSPNAELTRGVALGMHFEGRQDYAPYLWEIASTGATTVSLVFHLWQDDVRASALGPGEDTPSDDQVAAAIDTARELGLEVMLFPIVQLRSREQGDWRGVLRPTDRDAWFDSYRGLVVHYARLAEAHGVAIYSIGSELGSMEHDEAEWRAIVAEVGSVFDGEILYSANWDAYFATPFWDAVDRIGLTGYFELSSVPGVNPTDEELDRAWEPFVQALRAFAAGAGRPVVITEIGYVSQTGAAYHPWDYTASGAVDLEAQLDLYRAAFRALHDEPWLGGVFFWNWFGDGGSGDDGYTPRQKPAEQVVRYWYGGTLNGAR